MAALQEPKKPQASYFLYVNATREQFQKELGVKAFGPVTKAQSERWKIMTAAQKDPYEKEAAALKTQYEKDLAAFKEAGGVVGQARAEKREAKREKADKKARKLENADKPKRPAGGAFGIWLNANRADIMKSLPAGSKCTAVSSIAGARWKALSAEERQPFEAKYKEANTKYQEELKSWKQAKGPDGEGEGEESDADEVEGTPDKSPAKEAAPKKRATAVNAEKISSPPQKKAKGAGRGRGRGAASAASPSTDPNTIDPDVLQKASKVGLDTALKNLAARDGMSDIPHDKMLAALQQAGGLVNKAKVALLAGA